MADSARPMTDWLGFLGNRRAAAPAPAAVTPASSTPELSHPTKSLQKFLTCLQAQENPVLLDLGPVVAARDVHTDDSPIYRPGRTALT